MNKIPRACRHCGRIVHGNGGRASHEWACAKKKQAHVSHEHSTDNGYVRLRVEGEAGLSPTVLRQLADLADAAKVAT